MNPGELDQEDFSSKHPTVLGTSWSPTLLCYIPTSIQHASPPALVTGVLQSQNSRDKTKIRFLSPFDIFTEMILTPNSL